MNELKRIDQILAQLERRQAGGRMTYKQAIDTDVLITAFERIRIAIIARDNDIDRQETRAAAVETILDVVLRGST